MALEEPLRGPIDDIEKKMHALAKPMCTCVCASCVVMMAPPSMMAMMVMMATMVTLESRKLNEIETKLNEIAKIR